MNVINVNGTDVKLEYTYNSFKYMQDFDMGVLDNISNKPFKSIGICEELLFGALNHDKSKFYSFDVVSEIVEKSIEDGNFAELLSALMETLKDSDFFMNLQMMGETE